MTRAILPRPTLLPGLARLWRDRHTLQLGVEPGRAVLLEIANPRAARLLDLLDGSHSVRSILGHASVSEVAPEEARGLLDALHAVGLVVPAHTLLPRDLAGPARTRLTGEAGALALTPQPLPGTPAQVLRRRRGARVVVTGAGRLGGPVAVALAQAGIGHLDLDLAGQVRPSDLVGTGLPAADVGRSLAAAVRDAIRGVAPGTETRPIRRGRADLVLQLGTDRPAALLATGYAQRRQAHLLLTLRGGVPVVGPLVRPPAGPCLNCLDLHRTDRDPDWPSLAAQLAVDGREEACTVTTLLAATAYAAAEVLVQLDGGTPETLGRAVEIGAAGQLRRRVWAPHPSCGCSGGRRRSSAPGRSAGSPDERGGEPGGEPDERGR
ncbi:TOMM precursor leader peptide-binding protein [Micromonospora yangpuensis]|uniref:Bacteriocin biosynthesis cyclodehydratase domain-containing protein n=1 Tax=Micromonospora yangpuensis TaxID=683228 RepID=A0A1C6V8F2_9ACTN|nr:TOMM precursor leader peptide-binding protein [Micromonospora yangpuensis]GGM28291.1 thiamin biosynthesis protein [Micromonospora yangpuensis]SCL62619.1 bacteriocin biosynthesis cyclodehydratase domain-containing protein [Micromonospora yangpuensis]